MTATSGAAVTPIERPREIWDRDPPMDFNLSGPFAHDWMLNAIQLAEPNRRSGRPAGAAPIEAELGTWLSTAGADFPLVRELH